MRSHTSNQYGGRDLCVHGYHVYGEVWQAVVRESLVCEREARNVHDRYAVSVKKNGQIISHLPRIIARVCSLFLRRGGSIHCTVSGTRRYSGDLPQGGMEIPCFVVFRANPSELKNLNKIYIYQLPSLYAT